MALPYDPKSYEDLYNKSLDFKSMIDSGGVASRDSSGNWSVTKAPTQTKTSVSTGSKYTSQNGIDYNNDAKGTYWDTTPDGNIFTYNDGPMQAISKAVSAINGSGGSVSEQTNNAVNEWASNGGGTFNYAIPKTLQTEMGIGQSANGSYISNNTNQAVDFDGFLDSFNSLIQDIISGKDAQTENTKKPLVYTPPSMPNTPEKVDATSTSIMGADGYEHSLRAKKNEEVDENPFNRAIGRSVTY